MPRNVEIKARVADLEAVERRVAALAADGAQDLVQEDLFFVAGRGRLKLRLQEPGGGELIAYHRPDITGPKTCRYVRVDVADPAGLREILTEALGVRGVVRKRRRLYRVGQTRVHLDRVQGLGEFVELEVVLDAGQKTAAGERIAAGLMQQLGIQRADLIPDAYVDLLAGGGA